MITRLPRCTAATAAARAYAREAKRRLSDPINVINLSGDSYNACVGFMVMGSNFFMQSVGIPLPLRAWRTATRPKAG